MTTPQRMTQTMKQAAMMGRPTIPWGLWIFSAGFLGFFGFLIYKHPPAAAAGSHAYFEYGGFTVGILLNPIFAWAIGLSIKSITGPALQAFRGYREAKKDKQS